MKLASARQGCGPIRLAISDCADRGLDAGVGQPLGILDRDVLAAPVGVMDELATLHRPSAIAKNGGMEKSRFCRIATACGLKPFVPTHNIREN